MGALLGLALGVGLFLIWAALTSPRPERGPTVSPLAARVREAVAVAGFGSASPAAAAAGCAGLGLVVYGLVSGMSGSTHIGIAFAVPASCLPSAVLRGRARRRRAAYRDLWPDAVDNLASAIRAGMSLPDAVGALGERGPEPLREPFRSFARDYGLTGRFEECLDRLKADLGDPTGDRVVECLRLARQVGGTDIGRLLRALSGFLREDARTRAELEARRSWTISAARLAVAAPWAVLALLSLRPEAVAAYDGPAGASVLALGAATCALAYRLMLVLGRIPEEERVLASADTATVPGRGLGRAAGRSARAGASAAAACRPVGSARS